jgi:hypothetical protein
MEAVFTLFTLVFTLFTGLVGFTAAALLVGIGVAVESALGVRRHRMSKALAGLELAMKGLGVSGGDMAGTLWYGEYSVMRRFEGASGLVFRCWAVLTTIVASFKFSLMG